MTIQHTPTTARTDVRTGARSTSAPPARPYRRHGAVLTAGALAWAASIAVFGLDSTSTPALAFGALGAGAFQLGLLCLLQVVRRTGAIGTGRVARVLLRVETGLVVLAIGSTIADGIQVSDLDSPGWALLDACWPLSMLGMFAIGVRIAIAGRWSGATRYWPLVAESWAVVVIPTMGVLGQSTARWVAAVHLCVGYAVLGWLVGRERD